MPLGDGAVLHLAEAPFDSTAHEITQCDLGFSEATGRTIVSVCGVDGRPVFGTDPPYGMPRTALVRAELELGGRRIPLETSGMFNPMLRPNLTGYGFTGDVRRRSEYTVRGTFSDGGGAYGAEWMVVEGIATRTMLTDDEGFLVLMHEALAREVELTPADSAGPPPP